MYCQNRRMGDRLLLLVPEPVELPVPPAGGEVRGRAAGDIAVEVSHVSAVRRILGAQVLDALCIRDEVVEPLPLRGGVAAGRVILFEGDDYIGRPVNLAARLCDEAEPHQLLVTASLFDAAGEGLAHRRLGAHAIRGFTRPVEVVDMSEGGDHAPVQ